MTRNVPHSPSIGEGLTDSCTDVAAGSIDLSAQHGQRFYLTVSASLHVRLGDGSSTPDTSDLLVPTGVVLEIEPVESWDVVHFIAPASGSGSCYVAPIQVVGVPQ